MTYEDKEIIDGNILISKYMFGESGLPNYYQIGYRDANPIYRSTQDLCNEFLPNFHNNWGLIHGILAKMAKDEIEAFSTEDMIISNIKNNMFEFSFDSQITWFEILKYIKLKLTV